MPRLSARTVGGIAIALVAAAASVLLAPELPERMASHWNAAGQPDDTMARSTVLVGGPAMVAGIVVLFEVVPRIDPLGANIADFQRAYDAGAVLVAGFVAYTYGVVLAWNLGYEFELLTALAPAMAVLYVGVGFLIERAERNWFVGIRTPWTLSSERVWRRTHDLGGTLFKAVGVLALGAVVVPEYGIYFVVAPAVAVAVIGTVYSFVVYQRLDDGDPADAVEN
jgi:uncharacterized membrane protein